MKIETPVSQMLKAAKNGDTARVKELLEQDASLLLVQDKDGSTALHCAAWKGHQEVVSLLLEAGADVHAQNQNDHWGTTPLHAAAHGNRGVVAALLIQHGADIHAKDMNGNTPLHHTKAHNAKAVANLLQKHGATH